ncbi:YcnI family protein [Siccirubricoccus sp. KC 17139]|uniref:YcnI family protein n=1 Tax=Siccirubricoccus soli TaxID=2899147 RepID=A0ABT1CYE2_9PROT|nr:YcnI family protein [Siccirubricoccus soli]MCO6414683.1 YcnI family protein [Siccirubricoccus soli]MCP2680813.1 YcnI family protein [Siccirubricoccus soli]
MRLATAALAAGLLGPLAAAAHVTVDPTTAPAGSYQRVALRVPHGCNGAATTRIAVELPEGVYTAKPMPKPGWRLSIERRALPQAVRNPHGHEVEQEVARIAWEGGPLPEEQYEEFVLLLQLPNEPGGSLTLPVTQGCEGGKAEAWVERPAAGQHAHDLARPAPVIRLTPR